MRIAPRWQIGVAVFIAYTVWVMSFWAWFGIDYTAIGTQANLLRAVILPLGLAALALVAFILRAGWWSEVFREERVRKPVFLIILLALLLGFAGLNIRTTDWQEIGWQHTLVLATAMLLVGFCEEVVTRGVLLVSLRGSLRSEARVWLCSSVLFGLLHATNAFFGLGALALVQVVLAFCAGTGLYLLRRLCGNLWLPMAAHALWDFSSFGHALAPTANPLAGTFVLGGFYVASLVVAFLMLRRRA